MPIPIAVQLYTVRELTAKDFAGTMKQIAGIGYTAVELAGYGNLKTASEVKKALDDNGLKVAGMHSPLDQLEHSLDKVMDDSHTLGNKNIICPWIPENLRKSPESWKQIAQTLNQVGRAVHEHGFQLAYHNHSFEFQKLQNGQDGFDILYGNTDAHLVKAEIDVYWVKHGGHDPVQLINRLGHRVLSLHLKDMSKGPERHFAEVGTGILDFKAILAAAEKVGVEWGIVEQDNTYGVDPLKAIAISLENLKKLEQD
jgi:sugar phosphate isomerase/epimerase